MNINIKSRTPETVLDLFTPSAVSREKKNMKGKWLSLNANKDREKEKEKNESIQPVPEPGLKEIIAPLNRIRPVDSGIRAVDRITVCEIRLALYMPDLIC